MPTNLPWILEPSGLKFRTIGEPVQPAAIVPPVTLTHDQWLGIRDLIVALGELPDDCAPNEVRDSLIQGAVLHDVAHTAKRLKHELGL